jgi:cytochrome P450
LSLPSFAATLSLRIALRVLMGGEMLDHAEEARLMEAVRTIETDMAIGVWRMWPAPPWTLAAESKRRRQCLAEIESIVASVRDRATADSVVGGLSRAGLTDAQMRDELVTLLIAGHETTGSAVAWLLYHLSHRPDVAAQIAMEVDIASNWSGDLAFPDLRKLETAEKVVRETLRAYPSSWWFSREAQRDMEFAGRRLRKGDNVIVSPWLLHRDARWWGADAGVWNPDRPAPSVATAYIPYGTGARACIGMTLAQLELVAITAAFASACELRPACPEGLKPYPTVTLRPDPGLAVEFLPRQPVIVAQRAIA